MQFAQAFLMHVCEQRIFVQILAKYPGKIETAAYEALSVAAVVLRSLAQEILVC
jgi:hypothetical protein